MTAKIAGGLAAAGGAGARRQHCGDDGRSRFMMGLGCAVVRVRGQQRDPRGSPTRDVAVVERFHASGVGVESPAVTALTIPEQRLDVSECQKSACPWPHSK